MRLSIIIAAHNEGQALVKTVASCIETCAGLDYEILIADDASWDGSVEEIERRFSRVRVLTNLERLGPSPTKDRGARAAAGDVLIFLDGHTKPERGALARLADDVILLGGRAIVAPTIVSLDVGRWRSAALPKGHGYRVDLEHFKSTWLSARWWPRGGNGETAACGGAQPQPEPHTRPPLQARPDDRLSLHLQMPVSVERYDRPLRRASNGRPKRYAAHSRRQRWPGALRQWRDPACRDGPFGKRLRSRFRPYTHLFQPAQRRLRLRQWL